MSKMRLLTLLIVIIALSLVGCEKSYMLDYQITNSSQRNLYIEFTIPNDSEVKKNFIGAGNGLVLYIEEGNGKTTKNHLDNLSTLPFTFIRFEDTEGNLPSCDVQQLECWEKIYFNDNNAELKLSITELHFK